MNKFDGEFLEVNEFSDTHASLVLLSFALEKTENHPAFWKQAILSCHSALQGACVCLLSRTDGGGALNKKSEKALRSYHETGSKNAISEANGFLGPFEEPVRPVTKIAALPDLLKKLPPELRANITLEFEEIRDSYTLALKELHTSRNSFAHFHSHTWYIEKDWFQPQINAGLRKTREIVEYSGYQRTNRFNDIGTIDLITTIEEEVRQSL